MKELFTSTKTYGHELGLSCCFRQWRAKSHCAKLHGYALAFRFEFAGERDENGWVVDFGALKQLKARLGTSFDHVLAVAGDDPKIDQFLALHDIGLAHLMVFPGGVGCEAFAKYAYCVARDVIRQDAGMQQRGVQVVSTECREHAGNSAIYRGTYEEMPLGSL